MKRTFASLFSVLLIAVMLCPSVLAANVTTKNLPTPTSKNRWVAYPQTSAQIQTTSSSPVIYIYNAPASGREVAKIPAGSACSIRQVKGEWVEVSYAGKTGWCKSTAFTNVFLGKLASGKTGEYAYVKLNASLPIYTDSTLSKSAGKVAKGQYIYVLYTDETMGDKELGRLDGQTGSSVWNVKAKCSWHVLCKLSDGRWRLAWTKAADANKALKTFQNLCQITVPSVKYTGKAVTPSVAVLFGKSNSRKGTFLSQGYHFSVKYSNNVKRGTASATITGLKQFEGASITVKFKIT